MLRKPGRIAAMVLAVVVLAVESAYTTGFDPASVNRPRLLNEPMVRAPGHVLGALKRAKRIKSAPRVGEQPITLTLTLKRDHEQIFDQYLHELYDQHSPNYHHF